MTPPDTPHETSTSLLLVDVTSDDERGTLSIDWPLVGSSTRTIDTSSIKRVKQQLEALERAEQSLRDGEIASARGSLGQTLWTILDGPEGRLNQALKTGAARGRPIDLVIRLRCGSGAGLAGHPAARWRWELLSPKAGEHPSADGRMCVAVQMGDVKPTAGPRPLEYGGLRIMFMAYSPEGQPVLDYEGEEERLLTVLQTPLSEHRVQVQVVEDGTLTELERRLGDTKIDVLHLTGHGVLTPDGPRLAMEDDLGWPDLVAPGDLLRVLKRAGDMPELVVISSCYSAEGHDGLPSFAAALVAGGVPAVLGWVRPVRDDIATKAAADLYGRLCHGKTPAEAVAFVREQLREWDEQEAQAGRSRSHAWGTMHLLMKDAGGFVVQTDGGRPLPKAAMGGEALYRYLGAAGGMRVLERGFLGRRRQLQRVLRLLRSGRDDQGAPIAGVTVLGMKGVGKSCLVGRALGRHLQDRCSTGVVVLHGLLDEVMILDRFLDLAMKREDDRAEAILKGQGDELVAQRLRRLLTAHWAEESIIIVLDDFEQNLELRDDGHARLSSQAAALLEVLLPACQAHRPSLLMTTTASFRAPTGYERSLFEVRLGAFEAPTIRKLWTRLPEDDRGKISPNAWNHLADRLGRNARVLDWARTLLRGKTPEEVKTITRRAGEALPVWTEETGPNDEHVAELVRLFLRTLAVEETRKKLSRDALTFIARARVFEWPVLLEAFEGLVKDLDIELSRDITVLQNLGMLEVGEMDGSRAHRVSPLVEPEFEAEEPERWHAVAAEFWEKASQRDGTREWLEGVRRAWEHALAGKHEEVADRCGRCLHLILHQQGFPHINRELARQHRNAFPKSPEGYLWAGSAEQHMGELHEGWALYEQGEALAKARGTTGDELSRILREGSDILVRLGRFDEAEGRLAHVVDEVRCSNDQTLRARSLWSLAKVQHQRGRLSDAKANLEAVLKIQMQIYGTDEHYEIAASLHVLASVVAAQGDLAGARTKLERSLDIQLKVHRTEEHPNVAASFHELASVAAAEGDLAGARANLERSLAIKANMYGVEDHPSMAASISDLGYVLWQEGKLSDARAHLERSLAIKITMYGTEEHPEIAASLSGVAVLLRDEEKYSQSISIYRRVLDIQCRVYGTRDHYRVAETEVSLGLLLLDQGETESGREILSHAYTVLSTQVLGHPALATLSVLFGDVRAIDPHELAERALQVRYGNLQPNSAFVEDVAIVRQVGPPHDFVAEVLETVAGGRALPSMLPDLPEPIATFIDEVLGMARTMDFERRSTSWPSDGLR